MHYFGEMQSFLCLKKVVRAIAIVFETADIAVQYTA
jgi:hypothetical protein